MTKTKNIATILLLIFAFVLMPQQSKAAGASLYLSPSLGSYSIGDTFSVNVFVSSDTTMNAASGIISFSQDKSEVISISKSGSIFNLWVQEPSFSNSAGIINFEGIVLNPGFIGSTGKIITVTLKAKAAGSASLTFSSGSVLANDGQGTNILADMNGGVYTLKPKITTPLPPGKTPSPISKKTPAAPAVSSSTHPDSNKWHSNNNPEFQWKLPHNVTGVSILLNEKPNSDPGHYSDGLFDSKIYQNAEDGIWYLHLKLRNQFGWSQITHFKIQIDTKTPQPFEIVIKEGIKTDNPQPTLIFKATDDISSIEYYEVKIDEKDSVTLIAEEIEINPYKIPTQEHGKHTAIVKAVDAAGNSTISTVDFIIEPIKAPIIVGFPQTIRAGDTLIIKGTSLYPDAIIAVFVKKEGEEAKVENVKTDKEGNWLYIHPESLDQGTYQFWTVITDSRGAKSNLTEKITIAATLPSMLKFGKIAIDYLTIIITLAALVAFLILIILYAWRKILIRRKKIRKETQEIEESVIKAFKALREEVEEQIEYFDKKPGLTKKEKEIRDKLQNALDISEEFIKKEIRDVKKELK